MDSTERSQSPSEFQFASEQSFSPVPLPDVSRAQHPDDNKVCWDQLKEYYDSIRPIAKQWRAENEVWVYQALQRMEEFFDRLAEDDQDIDSFEDQENGTPIHDTRRKHSAKKQTFKQIMELPCPVGQMTEYDQDLAELWKQETEARIQELMRNCSAGEESFRPTQQSMEDQGTNEKQWEACALDLMREWQGDDEAYFTSFWQNKLQDVPSVLGKSEDTDDSCLCSQRSYEEIKARLNSGPLPQVRCDELLRYSLHLYVNIEAYNRLLYEQRPKKFGAPVVSSQSEEREDGLPQDLQPMEVDAPEEPMRIDTLESSVLQQLKEDSDFRIPDSE